MPYNPQTQYRGDLALGSGIRAGLDKLLGYWLSGQADETKGLRTQLTTIEPDKADQFDAMNASQLKGYAAAQAQIHAGQFSDLQKTNLQLRNQQLQGAQDQKSQFAAALEESAPGPPPGAQGPDTGTGEGTLSAVGKPDASTFVSNLMRRGVTGPESESVIGDWMRSQTPARGGPQPAPSSGLQKDPSGKFYWTGFDWRPVTELNREAPSTAPVKDPSGKFFWTGKEWKPVPQPKTASKGPFDLFGAGAPGGAAAPTKTGTGASADNPYPSFGTPRGGQPLRTPASAADAIVGQRYAILMPDGSQGVGVWDGENFVPE
jgi:hypothetical protein